MTNISDNFNEAYIPYKALLIYKCVKVAEVKHSSDSSAVYVESYDIAGNGNPINAHPLSIPESIALAELLQSSSEMQNTYLKSKGLLPQNLLFVNPDITGYAVWYTPPQQRELFFIKSLGIPCGKAYVPAMVWKASRDKLQVFALKGKIKPNSKTELDDVVDAVKNAKSSVFFSLFSATDKDLLDACLSVSESGKLMRGLVNSISKDSPAAPGDGTDNAATAAATWMFERSQDDNMVVGHDSFGSNNTPSGFWQESNILKDPDAPKPAPGDPKHFIPPCSSTKRSSSSTAPAMRQPFSAARQT